jgi:hypothetical protein
MRKVWLSLLGASMVAFLVAGASLAAEPAKGKEAQAKPKVTPQAQAVVDHALAAQLAAYGKRTQNPLALITAAQIMKNAPTQEAKVKKTTQGKPVSQEKGKGMAPTPELLLADAKALTQDPALLELIEKVAKAEATRDALGGPKKHVDNVSAGSADLFQVTFVGGEIAKVALIGDGDNTLDVFVYNSKGRMVAKATGEGDKALVEWFPRKTETFIVKIANRGRHISSNYILLTN